MSDHSKKTGNENIIKFYCLLQGTLPAANSLVNITPRVVRYWSTFYSDFKVVSADVLLHWHLGCPFEVSYRILRQNSLKALISFARDSNICWCGAAPMWSNFWKSGTKLLQEQWNRTHTYHQSKRIKVSILKQFSDNQRFLYVQNFNHFKEMKQF